MSQMVSWSYKYSYLALVISCNSQSICKRKILYHSITSHSSLNLVLINSLPLILWVMSGIKSLLVGKLWLFNMSRSTCLGCSTVRSKLWTITKLTNEILTNLHTCSPQEQAVYILVRISSTGHFPSLYEPSSRVQYFLLCLNIQYFNTTANITHCPKMYSNE